MGPRLKLPPYVHAFTDRHGKARFYFRRPGFRRAALPGLPYSSEFMAAYDAALHGARVELGASRSKPGTVAAAVAGYFGSMAFAGSLRAHNVSADESLSASVPSTVRRVSPHLERSTSSA